MSKRSRRRKRHLREKKEQSLPALLSSGEQAFKQADYRAAVVAWEKVLAKGETSDQLQAALAEAYFRRAFSRPDFRVEDFQQAVKYRPTEARYRYHLALAQHRQGELSRAEPLYRQLLAEQPPYRRAAVPLAQLLIERKKSLRDDEVWNHLDPAEQRWLIGAEAIIQRKATSTLAGLLATTDDKVWSGLLALALAARAKGWTKNQTEIRSVLQQALAAATQSAATQGVIHYYLGLLAAADGKFDQAVTDWQIAQQQGFDSGPLRHNLAMVAYRQVNRLWQAGQPLEALMLLDQTSNISVADPKLVDFRTQLGWEAGYQAAQQNDWTQALACWQAIETIDSTDRPLRYNLALAYQQTEHYWQAAQQWREVLRRRPRKADHPDALTEHQVTRIWEEVADNYRRAEDYEEAIKTYRTAIKWAPDNIDLRLKYVDALQTEGRWQAAENELNRVLEQHPDHVPALTSLAESYAEDFFPDRAIEIWQRILALEPQHPFAGQQVATLFIKKADRFLRWGETETALEIFQQGLEIVPNSAPLYGAMGTAYIDLDEYPKARQAFEQALAFNPNDLQINYMIYLTWLEADSQPDLIESLEQVKSLPEKTPASFFFELFDHTLDYAFDDLAMSLLTWIEQRYGTDKEARLDLALRYMAFDQDNQAIAMLRRLIHDEPDYLDAQLHLGGVYYRIGQTRLAKRHWSKAEAQARQINDQAFLMRLRVLKDELMHGLSGPDHFFDMLRRMPPDELERFLIETNAPPEIIEIIQDLDLGQRKKM